MEEYVTFKVETSNSVVPVAAGVTFLRLDAEQFVLKAPPISVNSTKQLWCHQVMKNNMQPRLFACSSSQMNSFVNDSVQIYSKNV